jgi:hypothetical protein
MGDRSRRPTKTQQERRVLKDGVESALLWPISRAHALSAQLVLIIDVVPVIATRLQAVDNSRELQTSRSLHCGHNSHKMSACIAMTVHN